VKLPAYGKELLEIRLRGKRPKDPVWITDCWEFARLYREMKNGPIVLVVDPADAPYDFLPVQGLDVIVLPSRADQQYLGLAERLARAQPASLDILTLTEGSALLDRIIATGERQIRAA
jgi:hypothetical protein